MSRRNDATSLRHMLDHAGEILSLAQGRSLEDLENDRNLELSLLHLLALLGESAGRVSEAFQTAHPEVPWALIIATRYFLLHAYDRVNRRTVWRTATEDIPPLAKTLERLLG